MAAKKRKIINRRRLKVAQIWERDPEQTQEQIRQALWNEFGIKASQPTISLDLKHLDRCIVAESKAVIKSVKDTLLEEYQTIYIEAMAAWERSLEDKVVATIEAIGTGEDDSNLTKGRLKNQERTEGQSGNPALLAQARGALQDIERIFGIETAQKLELGINGGSVNLVIMPPQKTKDE